MSTVLRNSRPTIGGLLMVVGLLIISSLIVVSCGSGGSSSNGGNGPGGTVSCDVDDEQDNCDKDSDTIANSVDNCPAVANPSQSDIDNDNEGDACDLDIDGDMVMNAADVDDDNDGLIEIYDSAMLWAMHCNADSTSLSTILTSAVAPFRYSSGALVDTDGTAACGASSEQGATTTQSDTECATATANGNFLCGYELGSDFAFPDGWMPLPDRASGGSFSGILEGNGYELSGLDLSGTDSMGGLFVSFEIDNNVVRNLRMSGQVSITSDDAASAGGVISNVSGGSLIAVSSAVTVNNQTTGFNLSGGLIGSGVAPINITINSSFATGAVTVGTTAANLGGLIGGNVTSQSNIANSYVGGALTGGSAADSIGGLIGLGGGSARISNSYVSSTIDGAGEADNVGGLIGNGSLGTDSNNYYDTAKVAVVTSNPAEATDDTENTAGTAASDAQLRGCDESDTPLDSSVTGCDGIFVGWSPDIWDFGTSAQLPALKHAEISGISGERCSAPDDGAAVASLPFRPNAIAAPYCGKLLRGQGRQIGAGPN